MEHNSTLQSFSILARSLSNHDWMALAEAVKNNSTLQSFVLSTSTTATRCGKFEVPQTKMSLYRQVTGRQKAIFVVLCIAFAAQRLLFLKDR